MHDDAPKRPDPAPREDKRLADERSDRGLWLEIVEERPSETVEQLLEHACVHGVSDLFFLTEDRCVLIMARHLGLLRRVGILSVDFGRKCMAHVKSLANMDITERRRPLDGRWLYKRSSGSTVDLRISSMPTLYGEDFTLRLLDRTTRLLAPDKLGLLRRDYNQLLKMLNSPSGLILVTGPTGSGKTTTLYACLSYLNNNQRKINTIEDPVEYAITGIRQSQVNTTIGVGFAELLRSTLRQAPDVIMIGEIRDPETAEIAVRAANSGHLVLGTLHAPVTAAAVHSMFSYGAQPYHLASSLLGVVSQRLVRTLNPDTKVPHDISLIPNLFDDIKQWLEPGQGLSIFGPGHDATSHWSGYSGRTGIFEVMSVTPALRHLIMERQPSHTIRQRAIDEGMVPLRSAALLAIARGQTSVEEVFRAIPAEYLS